MWAYRPAQALLDPNLVQLDGGKAVQNCGDANDETKKQWLRKGRGYREFRV